jgi:hypothetical protein
VNVADYEATVASSWTREATFDYLADFRNVAEWDPNMTAAELIEGAPGEAGARYRLVMSIMGKPTQFVYEAVEVTRPERFVMQSDDDNLTSTDTITVNADAAVTYRAELELKGLRKLVGPVAQGGLSRASNQARDSLAARLAAS